MEHSEKTKATEKKTTLLWYMEKRVRSKWHFS